MCRNRSGFDELMVILDGTAMFAKTTLRTTMLKPENSLTPSCLLVSEEFFYIIFFAENEIP